MNKIFIVLMVMGVISLIICTVKAEREPRQRYTIWVGSPAFGVGYGADSFTRNQDGSVTFQKKDGTTTTVTPYEIEDRGVKP